LEAEHGGGGGGATRFPQLSFTERKKRAFSVSDLAGEPVNHSNPRALQSVGLRMTVVSICGTK
jgi:hypothetical protein